MKKTLILVLVVLLFASCKQDPRTDFVINGKAEGIYNGIRVYLKNVDDQGREAIKDTAIVMDGKFTMKGSVEEPSVYFISLDGTKGDAILMLENSEIDIEINKENPLDSKVTGSKSHIGFVDFQDEMAQIREEGRQIMIPYRQLKLPEESDKRDSLQLELEKVSVRLIDHPLNFVRNHKDTYFSLNLIGLEANKPKFKVVEFMEAFNNLDSDLKASAQGKKIKAKLEELLKAYEKVAYLEIGKVAPNFEAPTPDGEIVSLNDLKGKVTIIDFWAAWCGPCRRENPNVVRIYDKYHDQGLEIVGVSLDGQSRQKDPKQARRAAIKQHGLKWNQVSQLK